MTKRIVLTVVAAAMLAACNSEENQQVVDKSIPVRVQALSTRSVSRDIRYSADLVANEQVFFAPQLAGSRIKKINVEVGDRISKGQVLVEMDETNLQQQQLQLKNLEIEYNRALKLKETGSISQQNFDAAETQYNVAKTSYENLLANTKMLAPFNGVVTGKFMEEGELYTGGAFGGASKPAVISIEQTNPIKAYVDIAEQYYLKIKKGMSVVMTNEVYGDREFEGKINIVYPSINKSSRTFTCEILFNNSDEALRPGMFGTVYIKTGAAEAMLVPAQSVLKVQGSNDRYVFIADGGKAKRVSVKILNRYEDFFEIEGIDAQLSAGDKLVTTGQARLIDQSPIKIVE